MTYIYVLVWTLIGLVGTCAELENDNFNISERINLANYLSKIYESARSTRNYLGIIQVKWGTELFEVLEVDKNCFMTVDIILKLSWKDDLLTWNPNDFGRIQTIHKPVDEVWKPKFNMQYSAGHDKMIVSDKIASISHTGHVTWTPHLRLRALAPTDFTYFPFDGHKFRISLLSWAPESMVKFFIATDDHENWKFLNPGIEWDIRSAIIVPRNLEDNDEIYSGVSYVLKVERRHTYHVYIIIFPSFVTGMLILLIMLFPHKLRFMIGSSLLFSLLIISSMLQEVLPSGVVRVPIIASIIGFEFISLLIIFLFSTITYHVMQRDPMMSRVPRLIKRVFMNKFMKYFLNFSNDNPSIPLRVMTSEISVSYRQLSEAEEARPSTTATEGTPHVHPSIADEKNEWMQLANILDKLFLFLYSILSSIIVAKICLPSDIPRY